MCDSEKLHNVLAGCYWHQALHYKGTKQNKTYQHNTLCRVKQHKINMYSVGQKKVGGTCTTCEHANEGGCFDHRS